MSQPLTPYFLTPSSMALLKFRAQLMKAHLAAKREQRKEKK